MKKLLLSLLFTLPALAQNGFRNEGGSLVWERVYPAGSNLAAVLEGTQGLQIASFLGNTYTGMGDEVKNTCNSGTPLMRNNCKFDFVVKQQDGSYVVTVTNLRIIEKLGPMKARIIANRAEKYFVDAALKVRTDPRTKTDMMCLDNLLDSIFSRGGMASTGTLTAN